MLEILARASVEGAVLAGGVLLVSRALPRIPAGVKAALWWCVAAKFVLALVWLEPVRLPLLPEAPAGTVVLTTGVERTVPFDSAVSSRSAAGQGSRGAVASSALSWTAALLSLWGLGLATFSVLTARRWRQTRAVVSRSIPADDDMQAAAERLTALLGIRRTPEVRLSTEVKSPLIAGVLRPVILVPMHRFRLLSPDQQRMALCHELAHLKRGDLWLGCVPAAAERIFFFHPLAHLAAREYVFWREAACDAAVLSALDAPPQSYGRLLLDLGVSRQPAALAAAGAAWSFSNLRRRIVMLDHPSTPSLRGRVLAFAAVALAVLAIAPVKIVARATPSADISVSAGLPAPVAASSAPAVSQPEPAAQQRPRVRQERPSKDDLQFVFLRDEHHTTMSGSTGDVQRARRLRKAGEPILWFRLEGKEYVVRDADVLNELERIWEPMARIGGEQGKVGEKQGAIGLRQGEIGEKQAQVGAEQGLIGARQGELGMRQGLLAMREGRRLTQEERADIAREREALEKEMRALEQQMAALGEKMRDLEQPMRDLGDDMSLLGTEMEVLGRKMEEASRKADVEMRALVQKAIASGAAEIVR